MKQTVVCAAERHGSSELVWSDGYEEYVPRNFERHMIKEDDMDPGSTRLVYKPEYEEYVPESIAGFPIGSESGCIIS